jgi:hypothetical protein
MNKLFDIYVCLCVCVCVTTHKGTKKLVDFFCFVGAIHEAPLASSPLCKLSKFVHHQTLRNKCKRSIT